MLLPEPNRDTLKVSMTYDPKGQVTVLFTFGLCAGFVAFVAFLGLMTMDRETTL